MCYAMQRACKRYGEQERWEGARQLQRETCGPAGVASRGARRARQVHPHILISPRCLVVLRAAVLAAHSPPEQAQGHRESLVLEPSCLPRIWKCSQLKSVTSTVEGMLHDQSMHCGFIRVQIHAHMYIVITQQVLAQLSCQAATPCAASSSWAARLVQRPQEPPLPSCRQQHRRPAPPSCV